MPSFILIYPTIWLQHTNVTDTETDRQRDRQTDRQTERQTGQRSDTIGRTVLQTVPQKSNFIIYLMNYNFEMLTIKSLMVTITKMYTNLFKFFPLFTVLCVHLLAFFYRFSLFNLFQLVVQSKQCHNAMQYTLHYHKLHYLSVYYLIHYNLVEMHIRTEHSRPHGTPRRPETEAGSSLC